MISLSEMKSMTVAQADPGELILYWYGAEPYPALRVRDGQSGTDDVGLIVFGIQNDKQLNTFLFDQVAAASCLRLGKAMAMWRWDAKSVKLGGTVTPGCVVITATGPAIVAVAPRPTTRWGCWRISDGTLVPFSADYPQVFAWEIGVMGIDGKFESVVSYPYSQTGSDFPA
jgi:hypothetical protein